MKRSEAAAVLNTPHKDEDIISVCDQLTVSLQNTYDDAKALVPMIDKIEVFSTLQ